MKTVQDSNGNIIEVADNTPCHAGINGALPVMLDEVIDAAVFAEMEERSVEYALRANARLLAAIIDARNKARGSWQEQIEYLIDNGIGALQSRDDLIKTTYPKP